MEPTLNLRDRPDEEYRQTLFDTLSKITEEETVKIVADQDIDIHLVLYQLEQDRHLEWDHNDSDPETRELQVTKGEPLENDKYATVDMRDLKPQRRHEVLLTLFNELGSDEGFVLVNDHDPKPLYHELRSMHGDVIEWEYLSRDDGNWQVEVVKTTESVADNGNIFARYDVREIPKPDRHPTIHHRFGMVPEDGTIELIALHEPQPLHREFRQQYGETFTWDVVENEPGHCRVHITKAAGEGTDLESAESVDTTQSVETGSDGGSVTVTEDLDVRDLPPAQRHEQIFAAYADLETGEGFVLINDHDPKPLYHQFEAEEGPAFRWEYRQEEPGEFRVLIGKAESNDHEYSAGGKSTNMGTNPPF